MLNLFLFMHLACLPGPLQTTPPHGAGRVAKPAPELYDSTKVSFAHSLPQGMSHKTVEQAVRTYGKIGEGKPLNHDDTVFLRKWSPDYLTAPSGRERPGRRPPQ